MNWAELTRSLEVSRRERKKLEKRFNASAVGFGLFEISSANFEAKILVFTVQCCIKVLLLSTLLAIH